MFTVEMCVDCLGTKNLPLPCFTNKTKILVWEVFWTDKGKGSYNFGKFDFDRRKESKLIFCQKLWLVSSQNTWGIGKNDISTYCMYYLLGMDLGMDIPSIIYNSVYSCK